MVREANKSPKILWAASAIANPPIPSPATNAVIFTPRLSQANNRKIVQIKNLTSLVNPEIAVTLCMSFCFSL